MFIIGSTPPGVLAKHFNDIAKQAGYHSETDLAKYLSTCSSQERNKILKTFYLEKEPSIKQLSLFNQIYDYKQSLKSDENVPSTKMRRPQQKKTLKPKIGCQKHGNKLTQRRPKHKDLNWDVIFQNEESSNEINEYAEDEDEQGSNLVETTTLKQFDNKYESGIDKTILNVNNIKTPVVSPVTFSERWHNVCNNSNVRRITENDGISTSSEVYNSDQQCCLPKTENLQHSNHKSAGNSVIDELLTSPTISNDGTITKVTTGNQIILTPELIQKMYQTLLINDRGKFMIIVSMNY